MSKIFGFDIGIASIGWSVVNFSKEVFNEQTGEIVEGQILGAGVRVFTQAEHPKDGSSLALPRREARLKRRTIRRKARRLQEIKNMFLSYNLVSNNDLQGLYIPANPWDLRVKALDFKLNKEEFARVLSHIAKHRGFKSYRKSAEENDKDAGKVLKAIQENKESFKNYRTLAEMIYERAKEENTKLRNTTNNYKNSIPRDYIQKEVEIIFNTQRELGNTWATKELEEKYKSIAFRHREVGSVDHMVGFCKFEKQEKRAPKNAPSAEFFVAYTIIHNNTKVIIDNVVRELSLDEKQQIFSLLLEQKDVKYTTIRKKLFKNEENLKFMGVDYKITDENKDKKPEDIKFYSLEGYHKLKKAFGDYWEKYKDNYKILDKIVEVVSYHKSDEKIAKALKEINLENELVEKLKSLSFDKFNNLSLKAIYNILPYMEQGFKYNEACEKVGYDFKDSGESFASIKTKLLPAIKQELQTNSPVVNRATAQFRKVYNAMVRKYGEPDFINIEMARDIKNSKEDRDKIKKGQLANKDAKDKAYEVALILAGGDEDLVKQGQNWLKVRLYEEQCGKCIYSGNRIDRDRLYEVGYVEIDHIIPYSRCFDDGLNNKVLCLIEENQKKGNKTPYEYFKNKPNDWREFCARVNALNLKKEKKKRLLSENFDEEAENKFKERNLSDTQYASRYIKKYVEDCIDFSKAQGEHKKRVRTLNGSVTAFLRHQWGLDKNRAAGDKHHAQDAIVIACATDGMVNYLSRVSGLIEQKYNTKEGNAWYKGLKVKFNAPWANFRNEVLQSLDNVFVSRAVRAKATGAAHSEQPKSKTEKDTGVNIRGGMVDKENMFRYDVFIKNGKYFVVPIYVIDLVDKNFKDVFHPADKKLGFIPVDESYEFLFSLHKDTFVTISTKEGEFKGYVSQYKANSGQLWIDSTDGSLIYKISTSTIEMGDVIELEVEGSIENFKVVKYNFETKDLELSSLNSKKQERIFATVKKEEDGKQPKTFKTEKPYTKLDKEKQISISVMLRLKKYQINPLGEVVEVKKELRLPIQRK